ncbi:MAG: DUF3108 domain-containing protein [Campylobacterales bacterium]
MRLAVLFLCAAAAWGAAFESFAHYKVGYGFFDLGEATAVLRIDEGGSYETQVSAKATGWAAVLSGDRQEHYVSRGVVVEGRLVPAFYEKRVERGRQVRTKRYRFDHVGRTVVETRISCKKNDCTQSEKELSGDTYAAEDILTLYHNITQGFIRSKEPRMSAAAIGSKKEVEVFLPEGDRLKTARKTFEGEPGTYLVVLLNQEIFTSDRGELYINIDSDRVATKAVLKKTLLLGDVWGELVGKKTKGTFDAGSY